MKKQEKQNYDAVANKLLELGLIITNKRKRSDYSAKRGVPYYSFIFSDPVPETLKQQYPKLKWGKSGNSLNGYIDDLMVVLEVTLSKESHVETSKPKNRAELLRWLKTHIGKDFYFHRLYKNIINEKRRISQVQTQRFSSITPKGKESWMDIPKASDIRFTDRGFIIEKDFEYHWDRPAIDDAAKEKIMAEESKQHSEIATGKEAISQNPVPEEIKTEAVEKASGQNETPTREPQKEDKKQASSSPEKQAQKTSKPHDNAFYIFLTDEGYVKANKAKKVALNYDLEVFVYYNAFEKKWVASEVASGIRLGLTTSARLQKDAIQEAIEFIEYHGVTKITARLQELVAEHGYGYSPRYQGDHAPELPAYVTSSQPKRAPTREEKPSKPLEKNALRDAVVQEMHDYFLEGERLTLAPIKKMAAKYGVEDISYFFEIVELAWVLWYRKLLETDTTFEEKFAHIVEFYQKVQPEFSVIDSNKKIFQQYSTPAPIAALANRFVDAENAENIFEPSAGNGLFLIGSPYERTTVNEIDITRLDNLRFQPFKEVMNLDASQELGRSKTYDAVICNPPFGTWEEDRIEKTETIRTLFGGFPIEKLEHLMVAHALNTMKDDGKAAIIVGSHTAWREDGKMSYQRGFFNWLYRNYNILDIININSMKLYRKQGTINSVMLLLIDGRKHFSKEFAPIIEDPQHPMKQTINTFWELYERVEKAKAISMLEPIDRVIGQLEVVLAA